MRDKSILQMLDRQRRVFRIATDPARYGLTLKLIAADSGLGYDSVRNYASGDTVMPITALEALCDVIPDEILSHLLGGDRVIVRVPDNLDHDEIAPAMRDYLSAKDDAHHPDSEAGRDIGPGEEAGLRVKLATVHGKAAA